MVLVALYILSCVGVVMLVASRFPMTFGTTRLIASSMLFLVLASPVLVERRELLSFRSIRIYAGQVLGAAVFFVAASWLLAGSLQATSFAALTVFFAALVEESVFRGGMPRKLTRLFSVTRLPSRSGIVGIALFCQLTFAASHFIGQKAPPSPSDWIEAARLLVAGVLYANIVNSWGLWLGAGVHAALNWSLLATSRVNPRLELLELALLGILGAYMLWLGAVSRIQPRDRSLLPYPEVA